MKACFCMSFQRGTFPLLPFAKFYARNLPRVVGRWWPCYLERDTDGHWSRSGGHLVVTTMCCYLGSCRVTSEYRVRCPGSNSSYYGEKTNKEVYD